MLDALKKFAQSKLPTVSQESLDKRVQIQQPRTATTSTQPLYPATDAGYDVMDVLEIVEKNKDLVDRIRLQAATDEETFQALYFSPIFNLAKFIHLLPATPKEHHAAAGGLFRLCLELGFFSFQSSLKHVFQQQEAVQVRRTREPVWRYAAFLTGLSSEVYRAISDLTVTNDKGDCWPALTTNLYTWLKDTNSERYFVSFADVDPKFQFRHQSLSRCLSVHCIHRFINSKALQTCLNETPLIMYSIMGTVAGTINAGDHNTLSNLVNEVRDKIINRDQLSQPSKYGKPSSAVHLEPHIIDAIKNLIASGQWKVNEPNAFVWNGLDGCYIFWKNAVKSIVQYLADAKISGIPTNPDVLADMLTRSSFLHKNPDASTYFDISPPGYEGKKYPGVKVVNPSVILDDVTPIKVHLVVDKSFKTSSSVASPNHNALPTVPLTPIFTPAIQSSPIPMVSGIQHLNAGLPFAVNPGQQATPEHISDNAHVQNQATGSAEPVEQPTVKTEAASTSEADSVVQNTPKNGALLNPVPVALSNQPPAPVAKHITGQVVNHAAVTEQTQVPINQTESATQAQNPSIQVSTSSHPFLSKPLMSLEDTPDKDQRIGPVVTPATPHEIIMDKDMKRALEKEKIYNVIRAMVIDFKKGVDSGTLFQTKNGIAFTIARLNTYQIDAVKAIERLDECNFLYKDPKKPSAKNHDIEVSGKKIRAVIILNHHARSMGFPV